MVKSRIFTERERMVIDKRLLNKRLTQVDSNYLYKFIRPKLEEITTIDANSLLKRIEYNQKIKSIEGKIKKIILENLNVRAIALFGSVVQTNYKNYNDVDILVVSKKKIGSLKEKYKKIIEIKKKLKEQSIKADIEMYNEALLKRTYPSSPSLLYQLKDCKIIYGKLNLPKKINLYKIDLHMKLDWSYLDDNPKGMDIYLAIRNIILVKLLLNKIISNSKLNESLENELGKNLIEKLKNNRESPWERKISLIMLNKLEEKTRRELGEVSWEKIKL